MDNIEVQLGRVTVGRWRFPNASQLQAQRISGGLLLRIPSTLVLTYNGAGPQPLVSNLSVQVLHNGCELGVASDPNFYLAANPENELQIAMIWRAPSSVIEHFEQARAGAAVNFTFTCRGEVCALIDAGTPGQRLQLRTAPQRFGGSLDVNYPLESWNRMLNAVGHGLHVLVDVPLRPAPPSPWAEIWQSVTDARSSFEQGGTTGWRNCVTSVRHALELWQQHEQEQHGAGWHAPTMNERRQRTRTERFDNLRWDLLQCAHEGPHSHGDDWARDDAVLMLATLAALLKVRAP